MNILCHSPENDKHLPLIKGETERGFPGLIKTLPLLIFILFSLSSCRAQDITLKEGDPAPDFTLQSDEGKSVSLSDFKGISNVILYFYPKDMTSGCTKQACNFRDNISQFKDLNADVLGVSVDDVESHKTFKEKESLNFTLLADPDKEVTKKYGVLNLIGLASRVTFVIDKNGIIKKIYDKVDVSENYKEILELLKTM
ncbi:MAG: peroxiredoxin [Ignavibacteria bacterium]